MYSIDYINSKCSTVTIAYHVLCKYAFSTQCVHGLSPSCALPSRDDISSDPIIYRGLLKACSRI